MRLFNLNIYYVIPLLLILSLSITIVSPAYSQSSYTVPGDFSSIQEAINNVEPGSTIYIQPGTYYESLVVNKSLSLIGTRYSEVVINGNNSDKVIEVDASNVVLYNLTIMSAEGNTHDTGVFLGNNSVTISHCIFNELEKGIYALGKTNETIYKNTFNVFTFGILLTGNPHSNNITGNIFNGPSFMAVKLLYNYNEIVRDNAFYNSSLDIPGSYNLVVENNTVNDKPLVYYEGLNGGIVTGEVGEVIINYCSDITVNNITVERSMYGVYISHSNNVSIVNSDFKNGFCGIYIDSSSNITIESNNMESNSGLGMFFYETFNSSIIGNIIMKSSKGIFLSHSNYNLIENNTIYNNGYGVGLYESINNSIYHNDFIDNNIQVRFLDNGNYTNIWDNGYPEGGNFWSDYTGEDEYSGAGQNITGSDGIGDAPYVINDYNIDHYPLMQRLFQIPDIPVNIVSITILVIAVVTILWKKRS